MTDWIPFRLPAPGEILHNGRPLEAGRLRAVQKAWLAGERRVWIPIRAHKQRMRRLHTAYPARWKR